ncbi:hypothetical protein LC76P1_00210 [Lysinibacillus phage LC76P1]|nr:hypothetical protein LC76P1_00210 [Lysinibacillus phage LC76P1]
MKVLKLEKFTDGVVQNWDLLVEYRGGEYYFIAYVKPDEKKLIGWHASHEVKDSDLEEMENILQDFVSNNEVKSPAVEFFEKLLEHNAGRSICNVAVENGDKETFLKYHHMVKGEQLDENL